MNEKLSEETLVICPKKNCPYDGCQHHEPHQVVWRHQISCTNTSRSLSEDCLSCVPFELKPNQSRLLTEVRTMIDDLVVQVYGRVHQVDKDTECARQILAKIDSIKEAKK